MGTPPLNLEAARETMERVEVELRAGYRPRGMTGSGMGAIAAAAQKAVADGFVKTTSSFETRITRCAAMGLEPDWTLYRPQRYQQPVPRQVITPAAQPVISTPGHGSRLLVIGDLHQNPGQPTGWKSSPGLLGMLPRRSSNASSRSGIGQAGIAYWHTTATTPWLAGTSLPSAKTWRTSSRACKRGGRG